MAQETQVVDLLNSSAANDTVRKVTTTPIGVIQERSLTDVPTIRTMSLDPTYQGKVQLSTPVFFSRAFERGLFVISGDSWATDTKELDAVHALGSVLLRVSYTARTHSVVELEEALLLIVLEHGRVTLTVAGYTSESVTELLARVKALLPAKVSTSDAVSIAFLARSSRPAAHWLCRRGRTSRQTILRPSPRTSPLSSIEGPSSLAAFFCGTACREPGRR